MQAGGQGFESLILHEDFPRKGGRTKEFIDILTEREKLVENETFFLLDSLKKISRSET